MTRSLDDSRRWVEVGTKLLLDSVASLDEAAYDAPTLLPGWSRRHLVSHVASNADGLMNLVRWAATGVQTPMYASPEARTLGIERGLAMSRAELSSRVSISAAALSSAMRRLTDEQWARNVVTVQGRTVPATEIPWLRAREVCVHTVDLALDVAFTDLPDDFLEALSTDIVAKRGEVPPVDGVLPERVAWLAGRPHSLDGAPHLGPWL